MKYKVYWPYGLIGKKRVSALLPKNSRKDALRTIEYWKKEYGSDLLCTWIEESSQDGERTINFSVYIKDTVFDDITEKL